MERETLKQRTEAFNEELNATAPAEIVAAFSRVATTMGELGFPEAVKLGEKAPLFRLPDAAGDEFSLESALMQDVIVLTFYRGSWCAYCNLQLRAYSEIVDDLAAAGARLVAVSLMTPENSRAFAENKGFPFTVLADAGGDVARKYGVVMQFDGDARKTYEAAGLDIPKMNGDSSWTLPAPSVFVIDRDGIVRFAHTDGDWRRRLEPADLVEAVRRVPRSS